MEISLLQLVKIIWDGKWLIGAIAGVIGVTTVILVLLQPDIYRAEALLSPNLDADTGGLASLAGQYGGLASLAGIQLGSSSTDKTQLGLSILRSRQFLTDFINSRDILVPLMAAKGWDQESGALVIDSDVYDERKSEWVRPVRPPRGRMPSEQEAYEEFLRLLAVRREAETGFVHLAVEHVSPQLAKTWLEWLITDLNAVAKEWDVSEANQALDYLNEQIASTSLSGLREVFYRLVEEQTKTIMLANVSPEYLLRTIDPPVVPEEKVRPFRSLIVLLALFLGCIIGTVVQTMRYGLATATPG